MTEATDIGSVYVYLSQFKVGITLYPAEVKGVYFSRAAAKKAAKQDPYAQIVERPLTV